MASTPTPKRGLPFASVWRRALLFISVFGPATITAMADNDASGVATYSIAGATLGYPILFPLVIITILLGVTQEMGMRLTIITRKGLADLIRERWGVKAAFLMFICLLVANMGTIITDIAAVKTTSQMFNLPGTPAALLVMGISILFVIKGDYKLTEKIMLVSCLFFFTYIFSAFAAKPDWGLALGNLLYPHGVAFTPSYLKDFIFIGMGVLGTTVTPWGQFFISSFAYDKKIERGKVNFSQIETYWGAFLTDFFSFFMIVATAATLFIHGIPLVSGEQAALAIEPFAGNLAGILFAVGILNAGFMGLVTVSLSTAYAFAEFFGISGSLNDSFSRSKTFYFIYIGQLLLAFLVILLPGVSLFNLAIATQVVNAVALPLIFYYLLRLTGDRKLMGDFANNAFQKIFAIACTLVIVVAAIFTVVTVVLGV